EDRLDILVATQYMANRPGNLRSRQHGSRHLVEQRLEQMVVALVYEGDGTTAAPEADGRLETAKSPADHHDTRCWLGHASILLPAVATAINLSPAGRSPVAMPTYSTTSRSANS